MKDLNKILEEVVSGSSNAEQNKLLNFIEAKKAEFESASDEIAVEAILNAAISANSITQEEKSILFTAVLKSFSTDAKSIQSQEDAVDLTVTEIPLEVSELPIGNSNQSSSSTSGKKTSDSVRPAVDVSAAAVIANDNIKKPTFASLTDTADPGYGTGSKFMKYGAYTANTTGGLSWLLTLYVGATWLAIGSLSSIQFRDDIENKYHTTINQMIELKNLQDKGLQYSIEKENEISEWEGHLKAIANTIKEKPENFTSFLDAIKKVRCEDQAKTDVCTKLGKTLDNYLSSLEKKQSKDDALLRNINDFEKNNNISNSTSKPAIKQDELLSRIEFMSKFKFRDMLTMPDQVLTLLLAIAMGVLGSTITMTWTFLAEKPNPPFKWYLLRPFVGALSALVMFIFAKAGQMTLTADINNSGSLSPFLLSLFGIAAGLLSDRAYAQMSSVSGKVLGDVGAEQARWSSHLNDELEKRKITPAQLAKDLTMDEQQITEIVVGVRAASSKEQQRISDRLGIAPRLLFSDIHP